MKLKEIIPLFEMSISIDKFKSPSSGRLITIQIRTGNINSGQSGRSEHYPAHIHVLTQNVDIPVNISNGKIISKRLTKSGQLTKYEYAEIINWINKYGSDKLINIFNKAMKGEDPEPYFINIKNEIGDK